jgi:hypothetical protein
MARTLNPFFPFCGFDSMESCHPHRGSWDGSFAVFVTKPVVANWPALQPAKPVGYY